MKRSQPADDSELPPAIAELSNRTNEGAGMGPEGDVSGDAAAAGIDAGSMGTGGAATPPRTGGG